MKPKIETVTAAELARRSEYSPGSITAWTKAAILTRTRGRYNLVESLEAIKGHEAKRANDGDHDSGGLIDLRRELLQRRIQKLDHELAVATGKVHNRAACCSSLIELRGLESRVLQSLGRKVAARLPEVPGLCAIVDEEVNGIITRLQQVWNDPVILTCPHCHQRVEKLVAEEKPTNGDHS